MSGSVEIVNIALARLGESPIQSLDEGTVPANMAKIFYDPARRSTLRDYVWNFALKTARLAKLAEAPVDFRCAYSLPSDCLRVLRLRSEGIPDFSCPDIRYAVRSNQLVTDSDPAILEYIYDCADPGEFDDAFIEAFSYRLASELAMPIKGSAEMVREMANQYQAKVAQAAALSGNENRDMEDSNPYVKARY